MHPLAIGIITLLKIFARHIAVNRSISLFIAVMSSQRCREIAVKITVANATRIRRLSAVACCVRVVMSRLGDCRVWVVLLQGYRCYESDNRSSESHLLQLFWCTPPHRRRLYCDFTTPHNGFRRFSDCSTAIFLIGKALYNITFIYLWTVKLGYWWSYVSAISDYIIL